jgi:pimeloyl-ACP methyl ester carboxylesterase
MQQEVPQLRFATTRLASGPQVHYAEQGDPGGEPILFLHGYTDSWFSFSRLLPLLPSRYHAFAVSQRGHGDSDRPDCCYTIEDLVADTVAFVDAVGVERTTLVGHSGGSFPARRVPETQPERVTRLVLIGSAGVAAQGGDATAAGGRAHPGGPGATGVRARVLLAGGGGGSGGRNPRRPLLAYRETGHAVQWERPERVAGDLDAFMRGG